MGPEKACLIAGRQVDGVDYTVVTVYSAADHPALVRQLSLRALELILEQQLGGEALDAVLSDYLSKRVYSHGYFKIVAAILLNALILPGVLYLVYYVTGSGSELVVLPVIIATCLFSCTAFITGSRTGAILANLSIPVLALGCLFFLPGLGFAELADPLTAGTVFMFSLVLGPISGITGGYAAARLFLTGESGKKRGQEVASG